MGTELKRRTWLVDAMHNFAPDSGADDDYCKGLLVGAVAGMMADGILFGEALRHATGCLPNPCRDLTTDNWPEKWPIVRASMPGTT